MPPEAAKAETAIEEQDLLVQADEEEEIDEDEETTEEAEPVDVQAESKAVRDKLQEKVERLETQREDLLFLGKQLSGSPDKAAFEKDGIFADLPKHNGEWPYIGNTMLYLATDAQVDQFINSLDANENLSAAVKRDTIRKIERYRGAYEDRRAQYEKQVSTNLQNTWTEEWALVENGCKEAFPDIEKPDIEKIWDYCQEQMGRSRSTKAACDASFDAKFELAVKAIRMTGLDKKLGKALPGEGRPSPAVPAGNAGSQGKRGAANAPSFTRKQVAKMLAHPEKVDDKTLAQVNKAMAEGRIK